MSKNILFHQADTTYRIPNIKKLRMWLNSIALAEGKEIETINYIFTSDEYLYDLNVKYLSHYTLTDVITFEYNEPDNPVQSDIFISIDRAKENAKEFGVSKKDEIHRLLVHGLLHLIGYNDHDKYEKTEIRKAEDKYLSLRPNFGI